jgi:hypothetical protein
MSERHDRTQNARRPCAPEAAETFNQDGFCAIACCRHGGTDAARAAANNQDIALGNNRQFLRWFFIKSNSRDRVHDDILTTPPLLNNPQHLLSLCKKLSYLPMKAPAPQQAPLTE